MNITYRSLHPYKYQLLQPYECSVPPNPVGHGFNSGFLTFLTNGELTIKPGYAWDGPSGPSIDTPNFMRGSLVHDALYQLIREGVLDMSYREAADRVLWEIIREDGMSKFRAWYVWKSVRWFGERSARP